MLPESQLRKKAGSTRAPMRQSLPLRSPIILPAARASGLTWKRSLLLRDSAVRADTRRGERGFHEAPPRRRARLGRLLLKPPPTTRDGSVDSGGPLTRWKIHARLDTAAACGNLGDALHHVTLLARRAKDPPMQIEIAADHQASVSKPTTRASRRNSALGYRPHLITISSAWLLTRNTKN
jgi:hypothetical protein